MSSGLQEVKTKMDLFLAIVKRAQGMGLARGSQFTQMMDLDIANDTFNLRLHEFNTASNADFSHDYYGIQEHINRATETFTDGFVPKFSTQYIEK